MKKILGTLATVLAAIETIILEPITLAIILVCKFVLHYDDMKFGDVYTGYRWLAVGWWLKMEGIGKDDLRLDFDKLNS